MTNPEFLVIDRTNNKSKAISIKDIKEKIIGLDKKELVMAYDIHAGFNIPANNEFKELLKCLNQKILIDMAVIDERKQSNDKPYSPVDVCVHLIEKGILRRKSVHKHKSDFVSKIKLNKEEILEKYKELLGDDFSIYSGLLKRINGHTLGDFLSQLSECVLREKLDNLNNIAIKNIRFDRFSNPHSVTYHQNHDILYIGQHKAAYCKKSLRYLITRFSQLGEKPHLIIIPINPEPYFKL